MTQAFLHAGQDRSVVPGLDMDHPIRREARLFEAGREEIRLRNTPEHLTLHARRDPGDKAGHRRTINRTAPAARNLMQATERQPAAGQFAIKSCNPEGQHVSNARTIPLKP